MKKIETYKAVDGQLFENADECIEYEKKIVTKSIEALMSIKTMCVSSGMCCCTCPFCDKDENCSILRIISDDSDFAGNPICWDFKDVLKLIGRER